MSLTVFVVLQAMPLYIHPIGTPASGAGRAATRALRARARAAAWLATVGRGPAPPPPRRRGGSCGFKRGQCVGKSTRLARNCAGLLVPALPLMRPCLAPLLLYPGPWCAASIPGKKESLYYMGISGAGIVFNVLGVTLFSDMHG